MAQNISGMIVCVFKSSKASRSEAGRWTSVYFSLQLWRSSFVVIVQYVGTESIGHSVEDSEHLKKKKQDWKYQF